MVVSAKTDLSRELKFTEIHKAYQGAHPAAREAACLQVQLSYLFVPPGPQDLLCGRIDVPLVGFSPQACHGFGYYCEDHEMQGIIEDKGIDPAIRKRACYLLDYWSQESTINKVYAAENEFENLYLPHGQFCSQTGIGFPQHRMAGPTIDFARLLHHGLPGLSNEIIEHAAGNNGGATKPLKQHKTCDEHVQTLVKINLAHTDGSTNGDPQLYAAMLAAIDAVADVCKRYSNQLKQLASNNSNNHDYTKMAVVLENITFLKPETFREALQLYWIMSLACGVMNYGRMDMHLGPFLDRDLQSGRITEKEALDLLCSLWRLIAECNNIFDARIVIGGLGRPYPEIADKFALLAMEASRRVRLHLPQLTLRYYTGIDKSIMTKAMEMLAEGNTYPVILNDDVNIPAIQSSLQIPRTQAEQYIAYGCGELVIEHISLASPNGVLNLLKALEITLHDGIDPMSGLRMAPPIGVYRFQTFEDLYNAYLRIVDVYIDALAAHQALTYSIAGKLSPFLLLSVLFDNCIKRGKSLLCGGIRHLGALTETYGNINAADSLTAIKYLVYDRRVVTLEVLINALDADFEGYSDLRELLIYAPKYGNNDPQADEMVVRLHEHINDKLRSTVSKMGFDSHKMVIIHNSANSLMGRFVNASADGRRAGEPMANGNGPTGGYDRNGVTALMHSLVKLHPRLHLGSVQNFKFSRVLFTQHREKILALIYAYFAMGGNQIMINVVNRGELEQAIEHPELYSHLYVRVGGFSARFIDLPKDVQYEILSRTLYE